MNINFFDYRVGRKQPLKGKNPPRPTRVLHIGNIANNAFYNARLMNELGFDCDVISRDYYHIMGYPEWEHLSDERMFLDQNRPDMFRLNIREFNRPDWFVQGNMQTCIDYLEAKRSGNVKKAKRLFLRSLQESRIIRPENWLGNRGYLARYLQRFFRYPRIVVTLLNMRHPEIVIYERFFGDSLRGPPYRWLGKALVWFSVVPLNRVIRTLKIGARFFLTSWSRNKFEQHIASLIEKYLTLFPERPDKLTSEDFNTFSLDGGYEFSKKWRKLLRHYDLVIGYGSEATIPMLVAGAPKYIAYEHGTIRDLPFEDTSLGRLISLAYSIADSVYMTNADSIAQSRKLKIKRVEYGLHGFDDALLRSRIRDAKSSSQSKFFPRDDGRLVFFMPSRQHWASGSPTWRKGNDLVIKAAAELHKTHPNRFKIVFVEWGKEVDQSKRLIKDCGVNTYFDWVQPMGKLDLMQAYCSSDLIIDQFICPCIGSAALEGIASGSCPVMTHLDDNAFSEFYGEPLPVINCNDVESIVKGMRMVIDDREASKKIVESASKWFEKYHSKAVLERTLTSVVNKAISN